MKTVITPNGGSIQVREKGDPAIPGAGRKKNPFKHAIRELSEEDHTFIMKGRQVDEWGNQFGDEIEVAVKVPGAMAVVMKALRQAAKGNAQARDWLTKTGWGDAHRLVLDNEEGNTGGFVLVLPENKR